MHSIYLHFLILNSFSQVVIEGTVCWLNILLKWHIRILMALLHYFLNCLTHLEEWKPWEMVRTGGLVYS